jgi:hypothetical protein
MSKPRMTKKRRQELAAGPMQKRVPREEYLEWKAKAAKLGRQETDQRRKAAKADLVRDRDRIRALAAGDPVAWYMPRDLYVRAESSAQMEASLADENIPPEIRRRIKAELEYARSAAKGSRAFADAVDWARREVDDWENEAKAWEIRREAAQWQGPVSQGRMAEAVAVTGFTSGAFGVAELPLDRPERYAPRKAVGVTCACCGLPFNAKQKNAKYCSPKCRKRARRGKCEGEQ